MLIYLWYENKNMLLNSLRKQAIFLTMEIRKKIILIYTLIFLIFKNPTWTFFANKTIFYANFRNWKYSVENKDHLSFIMCVRLQFVDVCVCN